MSPYHWQHGRHGVRIWRVRFGQLCGYCKNLLVVKAYSGEPLASVVTKTSRKATLSTRETERVSYPGPLPSVDEDPNISTVEQNIEVDSVDETPGWLVVYCMRIYDCINWCDSNITFSKTEK